MYGVASLNCLNFNTDKLSARKFSFDGTNLTKTLRLFLRPSYTNLQIRNIQFLHLDEQLFTICITA